MNLPAFSPRNLLHIFDACYDFPDDPVDGLSRLIEISDAEAAAAFEAAKMLGIVDDQSKLYELGHVARSSSLVARREILRYYVEGYSVYADWKRRVQQGFDPLEAARQVKTVYDIEENAAFIRDRLLDLGLYVGSLREEGSTVEATATAAPSLGGLISDVLNRKQAVEDVLSEYVGHTVWESLPVAVREHLIVALNKLTENEPADQAVREAGLAMDAFIADVGETIAGGYGGTTMGVAADKLLKDNIIVKKHKGYTSYGVNLRNAAEHPDTDAELNGDRWTIHGQSAQTYLRAVLDFIRSVKAAVGGRYEL